MGYIQDFILVEDRLPPKDGTTILGYFGGSLSRGGCPTSNVIPVHWSGWGCGIWENSTSGGKVHDTMISWTPLPHPDRSIP